MNKPKPNIATEIIALQKGDRKAFKMLYNTYFETLCQHLLNYSQNQALIEDVVQETFITIWTNRKKLHINTSLKSYLYKAVVNNYINNYRKKKKRDAFLESYYRQVLMNISEKDESYQEERLKKLDECIQELPKKCREVFLSTKFTDMKYTEVSELFKISLKTVEGHISKAYSLIRMCMA